MRKPLEQVYPHQTKHDIQCDGIALTSSLPGEEVEVARKGFYSTFSPDFDKFAEGILSYFLGNQNFSSLNRLLIHVSKDRIANIYQDFPYGQKVRIAVPKKHGQVVFKSDITDVESVFFEDDVSQLTYEKEDKLIFLFRSGWSFGLYFNLLQSDDLDTICKEIGNYVKILEFNHVFSFLESRDKIAEFEGDGWFPFVALVRFNQFKSLVAYYSEIPRNAAYFNRIRDYFTRDAFDTLTATWWEHPVLAAKKDILLAGIGAYLQGTQSGYILAIKSLITEIEGILRQTFGLAVPNKKIGTLLGELKRRGVTKYNNINSLAFPEKFLEYLELNIFASFNDVDVPPSRHAFSHGVATSDLYDWKRALQVILTIDQIRFFL